MSTAIKLGLSEKQEALRPSGIGASEIAAVAGIAPGGVAVWERKVGLAPEFEGNSLTEFGHRIERVIAEAWAERHPGVRIYTPGTLRHPTVPIALASPDRVVAPVGLGRPARKDWLSLLEIKTLFHHAGDYGDEGSEEVPERHVCQVQWQLEVCDMEEATLVALVKGDYREYPIKRDREFGGLLLEAARKWWTDYVLTNTAPPADGSDAYGDYLRRRYQQNLQPALQPDAMLESLVTQYRQVKGEADRAEKAAEAAKQALQAAIGEAEGVAGLCSWRNNKPSAKTDWEAAFQQLVADSKCPPGVEHAIAQQFTTTKPGARVLRLTSSKEK